MYLKLDTNYNFNNIINDMRNLIEIFNLLTLK